MERLRIEYETGYMELVVEAFFPCKLPVARKIAPLINRYCSDKVKTELLSELHKMADGYQTLCDMYKEKAEELPAGSPMKKHWKAQFRACLKIEK